MYYFISLRQRGIHLQVHQSETDFFFYPKKFWWEAQLQTKQDRFVIAFQTEKYFEKYFENISAQLQVKQDRSVIAFQTNKYILTKLSLNFCNRPIS